MCVWNWSRDEECVPRMLRSAISAFTRVFDAPSARSRASSTRYVLRRGALLIRGPSYPPRRRRSRLCGAA
jgi:hypothetical protein